MDQLNNQIYLNILIIHLLTIKLSNNNEISLDIFGKNINLLNKYLFSFDDILLNNNDSNLILLNVLI